MITLATTTAVTPVAASAIGAGLLGAVTVASLIAFLVSQDLCNAAEGARFNRFSERLYVPVIPLLFVFLSIVVMRVAEVLI